MTRFEIVGPRSELWSTLDVLQDIGVCHLEPASLEIPGSEHRLDRLELSEDEASYRAAFDELSALYEGALAELPASAFRDTDGIATHEASLGARGPEHIIRLARAKLTTYQNLQERIANLQENKNLLERYLQMLTALSGLHVPQSWAVVPLLLDDSGQAEKILEDVKDLAGGDVHDTSKKLRGGSTLLALAVPSDKERAVREYAWDAKIPEAVFPREYADLPAMKIRDKLEGRLSAIPDEIEDAEAEVASFLATAGPEMIALGYLVVDSSQRFKASQTAALSEYAFRLTGWIPATETARVEGEMAAIEGDTVQFQTLPTDTHHDTPPTHLTNPGIFRPAQTLLKIFPPPSYGGVDPTGVMCITFPLFFGWMVGDAGYGFVLLLLTLFTWWKYGAKNKALADICYVFTFAAFSAIFFGVVFGEYFGHFGGYVASKLHLIHMHGTDPWNQHLDLGIGRTPTPADMPRYLALSCLLGLIHMSVSLLFGIYQAADHMSHGDEHAQQHLLEKAGMLVALYGFFFISIGGLVPPLTHVGEFFTSNPGNLGKLGGLMVAGGMGLLVYALPGPQKVTGPIEGVAILSNTVSYARLMAVGAAGVVLADMANRVGRVGEGKSMMVALLFIFLSVLVHAAAFVLIIFDPLVQGLRLHYVEFFSKFYEPNGVEYTPFARKGGSY